MLGDVIIYGGVEGDVDEAVFRRLVSLAGGVPGHVFGKRGKNDLRRRLDGFNRAAQRAPWLVIVDLDRDAECPPPLRSSWLPQPAPQMCFRIAVRTVEAWLMADRERMAGFLRIPVSRVPSNPEAIEYPKQAIVELARRSRSRDIREDMVPRPGSGRPIGPAYTSRMIEFVEDTRSGWRPRVAAGSAPSLHGCLMRLQGLVRRMR